MPTIDPSVVRLRPGRSRAQANRRVTRFGGLGEAEVEELGAAVRQHDVGGFEIAVDEPLRVRLVERTANLDRDAQGFGGGNRSAFDPLIERLAAQQFHHQVADAVLLPYIVKRANMRMVQARNRPSLALEALPQIVAAADLRGENLDGHLALQSRVAGAVHLSHPTGAQGRNNLVGT